MTTAERERTKQMISSERKELERVVDVATRRLRAAGVIK